MEEAAKKLTSLYVMLGAACNMRCRHCIEVKMPRIKKAVSPKVIDYIKELTGYKRLSVIFIGGESMLYREAIKEIVESVGKGAADYTVISNGSLLTDEDVDWLNEYEVSFDFSNDGPRTSATGRINMFDDPGFCERFAKLKKKSVEVVHHAHCQDIEETVKYIREKTPGTTIYIGDLVVTSLCPDDYVQFDREILRKNEEYLSNAAFSMFKGDEGCDLDLANIVMRKAKIANLRINKGKCESYACGVIGHTINIDLQGNVFLCHVCSDKIGTIDDPLSELQERSRALAESIRQASLEAKGCLSCEAKEYCSGKCPLEPPSANQKKGCEAVVSMWRAVGKTLKKIGDYENENR